MQKNLNLTPAELVRLQNLIDGVLISIRMQRAHRSVEEVGKAQDTEYVLSLLPVETAVPVKESRTVGKKKVEVHEG